MIKMAQDFMDILRIKKEEDDDEGAVQTDSEYTESGKLREGATGQELVDRKQRKKEREVKDSERDKKIRQEMKEKRRIAEARTVSLWTSILEQFSTNPDITSNEIKDLIRKFTQSYMRPRNTSAKKINDLYQSIVNQEADPKLLDVFFVKPTGIEISGDAEAVGFDITANLIERDYNGKESLDVLQDFLERVAEMPRDLLAGPQMTKEKLRELNILLRETDAIDLDRIPRTPDSMLKFFRKVILMLDKIKDEQEGNVQKADGTVDAEDVNWKYVEEQSAEASKVYDNIEFFDVVYGDEVSKLLDVAEKVLEQVWSMRTENNNQIDPAIDKVYKKMKQLINVTIGNYSFEIKDGDKTTRRSLDYEKKD